MGFGILDAADERAPGTVYLVENERDQESHDAHVSVRLKHGTGKSAHIILVPQPSDDPNDPLNWGHWRKDWIFLNICIGASMLVNVPNGLIKAAIYQLTTIFDRSLTDIAALAGYVLLAIGSGAPFVAVLSKKYGKRPQFLLASFLAIIGTIICLTTGTNYDVFLIGRIFQGIGAAAYESIIFNVIGDMYFVHERGIRVAVFNIVQASVALLPPIISGVITTNQGWLWPFKYYMIFISIQFLMAFLFIRETSYKRAAIFDIDLDGERNIDTPATVEEKQANNKEEAHVESAPKSPPTGRGDPDPVSVGTGQISTIYRKKTWWQHLRIWNGTFDRTNPVKLFFVVFACGLNPATIYSIFVAGIIVSFWVGCGFVWPQVYGPPPYSLDSKHIGYLYSGSVIGGTIVCLLSTFLYDRAMVSLARWNKGVYEPEMRLWIMVFALIFGIAGFLGLGFSFTYGNPTSAAACYALVGMAISLASIGAGSYIIDAYRGMTTEIFILAATCKNMLYFMQSKIMNKWIAAMSPRDIYAIVTAIVGVSLLSTIPMYIYGKRLRVVWARWNIYERLHLSDISLD